MAVAFVAVVVAVVAVAVVVVAVATLVVVVAVKVEVQVDYDRFDWKVIGAHKLIRFVKVNRVIGVVNVIRV